MARSMTAGRFCRDDFDVMEGCWLSRSNYPIPSIDEDLDLVFFFGDLETRREP